MLEPPLRPARAEDAETVTALVRGAYRGEGSRAGWTTEADLLDDERVDVAAVAKKITAENGAVLVLERSGAIVGCCELADRGDGLAYFGMFAVRPDLQAAGLGRLMLTAAEEHARREWAARVLELTVIGQRGELIAWYERRGYRLTGETRPFPFDELINGRALRPDLHFVVLSKVL